MPPNKLKINTSKKTKIIRNIRGVGGTGLSFSAQIEEQFTLVSILHHYSAGHNIVHQPEDELRDAKLEGDFLHSWRISSSSIRCQRIVLTLV